MNDTARESHLAKWQDRLLDAIDRGEAFADDAELRAHVESCELCRERHATLLAMHLRLRTEIAKAPTLSSDFAARVYAHIDEQESTRRAAAKLRAEKEFRRRAEALGFNWREFWRRQFGSVLAAATVAGAFLAALSSTWDFVRQQVTSTFGSLPLGSNPLAMPATFMIGAPLVAGATMLWLRSKSRS